MRKGKKTQYLYHVREHNHRSGLILNIHKRFERESPGIAQQANTKTADQIQLCGILLNDKRFLRSEKHHNLHNQKTKNSISSFPSWVDANLAIIEEIKTSVRRIHKCINRQKQSHVMTF